MMFRGKFDRARRLQRERQGLNEEPEKLPEDEGMKLEKGDLFAMISSAFLTLFLPAALVLLALGGFFLLLLHLIAG